MKTKSNKEVVSATDLKMQLEQKEKEMKEIKEKIQKEKENEAKEKKEQKSKLVANYQEQVNVCENVLAEIFKWKKLSKSDKLKTDISRTITSILNKSSSLPTVSRRGKKATIKALVNSDKPKTSIPVSEVEPVQSFEGVQLEDEVDKLDDLEGVNEEEYETHERDEPIMRDESRD